MQKIERLPNSPLKNKSILFLGSSVTFGTSSEGESFADFIAKRNGCMYTKEAVGGTTLVDEGESSYLSRLKKIDKTVDFDLFICQLSTNDATKNKTLGEIDSLDTKTVCGAVNVITSYVRETWCCPVVFYTNCYYESASYKNMVAALREIAEKKNIGIIDLYTDKDFNAITGKERALYMADAVHPTKAGYLLWWTPKMEEYLYSFIS